MKGGLRFRPEALPWLVGLVIAEALFPRGKA